MGGSSQTQTTQSTTSPWAQAQPEVNGLLSGVSGLLPNTGVTPAQTAATNTIENNNAATSQFAPAINSATSSLLAGGGALNQAPIIQAAYNQLQGQLAPYTASGYSTLNTPAVQGALQQAADDVTNSVNSQFAAAGRSGSAMNSQALSRGIMQAEAPIILNQANTDTQTQLNADNTLYGAAGTTAGTLGAMQQNYLNNQQVGVNGITSGLNAENAGAQSTINAEQNLFTTPAQNLGLLAQIGIPLAQLGQTSNGTTNTQSQMSPVQEITSLLGGIGSLFGGGKKN